MTAPWSGSEEAAGEDELGEGVGSAEGVASAVGAALGLADALGVEDAQERPHVLPLGRLGAVHADGHIFAGAVKFIPGVLRTHAFRLSDKREWGASGARGMWRGLCGIRLML